MSTKLIGFAGPLGCGKTTAAKELYHAGWHIIRFAGPLKSMLAALGLTVNDTDGAGKENPHPFLLGKTPRYAMQTLGTEWGRNLIHPNIWTDAWFRQAEKALKLSNVVADDLRFPNEANLIRALGGRVIRIQRTMERKEQLDPHASEVIPFSPDITICNDGSIEDFKLQIRALKH